MFMAIAVIIFLASIGGAGFTLFWKSYLLKAQEGYKEGLEAAEKRFDTALIDELQKANSKIDLTKQLLKNHIASSEIFTIISRLTADGIVFNSFEFAAPTDETSGVKITMKGVGNSFSSIAWQSDVFGQSGKFGTNKILKNPVLNDLVLQDNGSVEFTFTATLNPDDISYEKVLVENLNATGQ